ncbi:ABC transporter permease [Dawidia soli]|uniref:ABC transporter permease n=1 Tax=Dawidia soli TaxID=2782352 RepID=A0AAP2DFU8_9BACT|nr:ABC transporter permease [Dawidia soli]MBT1689920.1 ABC transporter permease [Dawidia soli]
MKKPHEIVNMVFVKLAWRNLARRKGYALLNIAGLAVGLVSFLLIMQYIVFERSYDTFHTRGEDLYRVAFDWGETDYTGNNSSRYAGNVPAMGPVLKEELSTVEAYTRFVPVNIIKAYTTITHRVNDRIRYNASAENGFYADSAFLQLFSFPIQHGDRYPLAQPYTIALTQAFAAKIFGTAAPEEILGQTLEIDNSERARYTVTALLQDIPANSHIQFDYLISFATIQTAQLDANKYWSQFYTYVRSTPQAGNSLLTADTKPLLHKLYGDDHHISIFFQPLRDIHLHSRLREELSAGISSQHLLFLTVIAYAIIAMAWVNYVNMFLSGSLERANEIGIKKILGSTRAHLVVQFLAESVVIHIVSVALSVLILLLIHPSVEAWLGIDLPMPFAEDMRYTWITGLSIVAGCAVTGLYPALLVSAQPIQALGARLARSSHGTGMKAGLVYFQFVVAFVVVSSAVIVGRQVRFMKHADLGIDLDNRIVVRSPGTTDSTYAGSVQAYKAHLQAYPFIRSVSFASAVPGMKLNESGYARRIDGPSIDDNNVFKLEVDQDFLRTYGVQLLAGRPFSDAFSTEAEAVIINEATLSILKFSTPAEALHQRIRWRRQEYEVVGVCTNYNHQYLQTIVEPLVLCYNPTPGGFATLQVKPGYDAAAIDGAKRALAALFPDAPFEYEFIKTSYDKQYAVIDRFETAVQAFAAIAVVIACAGLFALAAHHVQYRTREIAVRKVFGARTAQVVTWLTARYVRIVLISAALGSVVTFYAMQQWLQNFAFAITPGVVDFGGPLVALLGITLAAVAYPCIIASWKNPARTLAHR